MGGIILEEAPWYIFAIREASLWVCDHIPAIPLPPIPMKDPNDGEDTTWRDYYGELNHLWRLYIDMGISDWTNSKIKFTQVKVGYNKVREIFFKGNEEHFLKDEEIAEELRKEHEE